MIVLEATMIQYTGYISVLPLKVVYFNFGHCATLLVEYEIIQRNTESYIPLDKIVEILPILLLTLVYKNKQGEPNKEESTGEKKIYSY